MKTTFKILLLYFTAIILVPACNKDNDGPEKIIVKIGAQSNTTSGAFYSIGEKKVYTQALAYENQDTIDILCFYEEASNNFIALSSPGANITNIFGGTGTDPINWTTKKITKYTAPSTAITTAEFDLLKQNDAIIESYFDNTVLTGNKKVKNLAVDNIYAFKTQNNIYGLFKVISVVQGANGYAEIELKLKF